MSKLMPACQVCDREGHSAVLTSRGIECPEQVKLRSACQVCDREGHSARLTPRGIECPARVIRIQPEVGSAVPGSSPGTR